MKQDVYHTERRIQNIESRLESSSYSQENVDLIMRYRQDALTGDVPGTKLKPITISGNLEALNMIAELVDFPLQEATEAQLKELVGRINRGDTCESGEPSPWTLLDYKRALKNLYKWLYDSEDPEVLSFMSVYIPDKQKPMVDPDELLTVPEIEEMINLAQNPRDKALIGLMYDTGARISELLNLNYGDINFRDDVMSVNIRHGKNGPRKLYTVESIPLVRNWLKRAHRTKNCDDPLFYILSDSHHADGVRRQTYSSARNQLDRLASDARIDSRKRWNPHGIRRARATDMARKGMNQPSMNAFFGWVPGSQVPKYYIRLAQRDLERSIRDIYPGLEQLPEHEPKYLGENIPEYGSLHLSLYEEMEVVG